MDDSVQIRCTKCRSPFRDRARRIQVGYSRQCPQCEVLIFFEESSADKNVQRALLEARRIRRALQDASVDEIRQSTAAFGPEAPRGLTPTGVRISAAGPIDCLTSPAAGARHTSMEATR